MSRLKGYVGWDLEPLWDQILLPSASMEAEYKFFAVGQGGTDNGGTGAAYKKSIVDTNQDAQTGRLQKPEEFSILAISLVPEFDTAYGNLVKLYNKSVLVITGNGNGVEFRVPTRVVTAGCGLNRTDAASTVNGVPSPQGIVSFPLEHSIDIGEGESYGAKLQFPVAQTFTADLRVMLILWGFHKKGVGKR